MSYQALLFCPDERTASVVTQVLSSLEFSVELCNEPFAAVKKLTTQHYDALVVDCDNEQNAGLLFKSSKNSESNHSSLAVAVVEGQAGVAKAFRIGANLVLTKPINIDQAKGTLRVARGLLRKTEAKPGTGTKPATPSPVAPAAPSITASAPARPSTPLAPSPKLTFAPPVPKIPKPAPQVAAASAFSAPTVQDEPVSEASIDEDLAIAPAPEPTPEAAEVKPAAKEYPWQPVSKPKANSMASALQRAAEAARVTGPSSQLGAPEPVSAAPALPSSHSGLSLSGAASAPAPARDIASKALESKPSALGAAEPQTKPEPAPTKLSITDPLAEERVPPTESSMAVEPPRLETLKSGSSSKKGLISVLVILALAAGGYFGWTKYKAQISQLLLKVKSPSAAATQVTQPVQTPATPEAAPVQQKPSATVPDTNALAQQEEPKQTIPSDNTQKPAPITTIKVNPETKENTSSATAAGETPEPAGPAPLLVKNGEARTSRPAVQPSVEAPPDTVMASSGGEKTLSGIVGSVPARMPKEGLQELRVSQGVMQGMIVKKVAPKYPPQAERLRLQGAVQLAVTIAKDGSITSVSQLKGEHMLGTAAIEAVKQWKYRPYLVSGQPVIVKTEVTISFRLP